MIEEPSQPTEGQSDRARLCLTLGAGGIRGLAHIGVLSALWEAGCLPDAVLGASSGALVAATYASLGWEPARIESLSRTMGPMALLEVAFAPGRLPAEIDRLLNRRPGWFTPILEQMEGRRFEDLRHGVRFLGITCFDLVSRRERLFVTSGRGPQPTVLDAMLGSSALPVICRPRSINLEGTRMRLIDGGLSRTLPVASAFGAPIRAERVLAVDLQVMTGWNERALDHEARLQHEYGDRLRILKPSLGSFGTLLMKRGDPERLVAAGKESVTQDLLEWLLHGSIS